MAIELSIKDGEGGKVAKVTDNNQLAVASVSVNEATHISSTEDGAYAFNFTRTFAAADTTERIGFLQYTGDFRLQVDAIITSYVDADLTTGDHCSVNINTGAVYTSGGAAIVPVNLNLGSSNLPDHVSYSGSTTLVLDVSGESKIVGLTTGGTDTRAVEGAIIMSKNDVIHFDGQVATIGNIVNMTVIAYEVKDVI